jgi:hypothetical protein
MAKKLPRINGSGSSIGRIDGCSVRNGSGSGAGRFDGCSSSDLHTVAAYLFFFTPLHNRCAPPFEAGRD